MFYINWSASNGIPSHIATEIGRQNATPFQPNATQLPSKPTDPDPVSLMAQQTATRKANSNFAMPVNQVLPNMSASTFPTTGCSKPNVPVSQWAPQGLSRAPILNSDSNATVPQVVPVTSGGTVYYLDTSSGSNLVGGVMPSNVSSPAE